MRRFFVIFVLISALTAGLPVGYAQRASSSRSSSSSNSKTNAAARSAAENITTDQLRDYLSFVASDEMEGRDTPSRGLNVTAKFIATLLARWGVKPAGDDGTYFQKIAMRRARLDPAATRAEIAGQSYTYGEDFLALPVSGTASGAALVYVGHGWLVKSKQIDALRGLDVRGKIVIVNGMMPPGVTYGTLQSSRRGEDWVEPAAYAKQLGAVGIVELPDFQTLANWERFRRNQQAGGSVVVEKFQRSEDALPSLTLSPRMASALFQGERHGAGELVQMVSTNAHANAVAPFELSPAKKMSFNVAGQAESLPTQNVVAVIEGSDPVLKHEYVAVGAHYDHVGMGPAGGSGRAGLPAGGNRADVIYNGADDDGSGTVSLLAMAEALSRSARRPKRSILFVWHCGEEKGLWGSEYFVTYPTVPLERIVAQFNIDMIGRSRPAGDTKPANRALTGPNEIYVIGSKMMSTELGELSERINAGYLNLQFNYLYDNPADPNRFFFRSDHFNYAQKGIPIIFYFDGEHEDYHRPTDELHKIDFEKMQRVARTIFVTLWEVAELKTRPRVDKKLPAELSNN